jgi:hypothetical protein
MAARERSGPSKRAAAIRKKEKEAEENKRLANSFIESSQIGGVVGSLMSQSEFDSLKRRQDNERAKEMQARRRAIRQAPKPRKAGIETRPSMKPRR